MRFGLFQMAEYVNMITLSALAVTLFFGGWYGPWAPLGPLWFLIKLLARDLRLHLDPRDAAAPALRPADALRLEGAAAGGDDQRAHHRGLRGGLLMRRSRSTASRASASPSSRSSRSRSRSSTRSTSGRSTRASAAATGCTCTRTGSRSASAARSARPPARPTASASSPPRTPPTTASPPASATRASTRST